jgi:hypothetical protein
VDVNDTNAKLQIKNELKVVNIAQIKPFVEEAPKRLSQDESCSSQSNQRINQDNRSLFQDQQYQPLSRPMTRALKKLTNLNNAASMAISILENIDTEDCYGNIFLENFNKNHCKNCRNGICNFLTKPNLKQFLPTSMWDQFVQRHSLTPRPRKF